jgi:hypothetical protein
MIAAFAQFFTFAIGLFDGCLINKIGKLNSNNAEIIYNMSSFQSKFNEYLIRHC